LVKGKILIKVRIKQVAQHGLIMGAGLKITEIVIKNIPVDPMSPVICNALPNNLLDEGIVQVLEEKVSLDPYDQSLLLHLFEILGNPDIPFHQRMEIVRPILNDYLSLIISKRKRATVLICILLYLFRFI
jgi:hypothetical protein